MHSNASGSSVLKVHAALAAVLTFAALIMSWHSGRVDPVVSGAALLLGVPWSFPATWLDPFELFGPAAAGAVLCLPMLVNVLLHALVHVLLRGQRQGRRVGVRGALSAPASGGLAFAPVWAGLLGVPCSLVAGAGTYLAWLGLGRDFVLDPDSGQLGGPFAPGQALGAVVTLALLSVLLGRVFGALWTPLGMTVGFTVLSGADALLRDPGPLLAVGVVMTAVAVAVGSFVFGVLGAAFRRPDRVSR